MPGWFLLWAPLGWEKDPEAATNKKLWRTWVSNEPMGTDVRKTESNKPIAAETRWVIFKPSHKWLSQLACHSPAGDCCSQQHPAPGPCCNTSFPKAGNATSFNRSSKDNSRTMLATLSKCGLLTPLNKLGKNQRDSTPMPFLGTQVKSVQTLDQSIQ